MNTEPKLLAALFFIPRQSEKLSIKPLLQTAAATDISLISVIPSDRSGLVDCTWAGMACKAYLDQLSYHHLLQIYFWQSQFLELLPEEEVVPLNQDPSFSLAQAFKSACEALDPDVAFIATHLDQAQRDFILEQEWIVLAQEANRLADTRFGLLYLNGEVSQYWTSHPLRDDRDSLPISSGKLVFANRGASRWF
jgi:hypothetical protein